MEKGVQGFESDKGWNFSYDTNLMQRGSKLWFDGEKLEFDAGKWQKNEGVESQHQGVTMPTLNEFMKKISKKQQVDNMLWFLKS